MIAGLPLAHFSFFRCSREESLRQIKVPRQISKTSTDVLTKPFTLKHCNDAAPLPRLYTNVHFLFSSYHDMTSKALCHGLHVPTAPPLILQKEANREEMGQRNYFLLKESPQSTLVVLIIEAAFRRVKTCYEFLIP